MEKIFKLKENGTNIKTEFFAGLITFCAMAYILMVNANMYSNPLDNGENIVKISYGAIYVATALSAVICSFLMGLVANLPVALASGMGLNAFFIYTVCLGLGFSYSNALVIILMASLLFFVLASTGLLRKVYTAIPDCIRVSISSGIGLFIAFLGLQNAGIIVKNSATGIAMCSFNVLHIQFAQIMPSIVTLISLYIISIFAKKNIKGALLLGLIVGVVVYYSFGSFIPEFYDQIGVTALNPLLSIKQFISESLFAVYTGGFDFSNYIVKNGVPNLILTLITTSISFCLINIFDNFGSMYAATSNGGLLDKKGEVKNIDKAMLVNSVSAGIGASMGVSTVTVYVESTTGIMEGGRTGLTSMFVGIFFLISIFFGSVAHLVPSCVTAAALIYVGVLMMSSVKNIDWQSIDSALPAFLTICMMPYTCNISNGIAFGLLSYVIICACTGKFKEVKPTAWVIALLFVLMLLFSH